MEKKVIVIGAGPAGVSAALYLRRAGIPVQVVYKDSGALAKAEKIENYYGFPGGIAGKELFARGIEGAQKIGVDFLQGEVMQLGFGTNFDGYTVEGQDAEGKDFSLETPSLVLAAGGERKTLTVPGVKEFEGKGVSYCAICDAFFYRGKDVAVVGAGEYALHEAEALLPHAAAVHVLTDGAEPLADFPPELLLNKEKIAALEGEAGRLSHVRFADGSLLPISGVFLALGTAGSTALAKKMGILLENNHIKTDDNQATNVPGVFAAGDATGGLLQVAKAVYEGAKAGLGAVQYLREKFPANGAF